MLYRVNTYQKFGLPGRPQIEIRILTGPWNPEPERAKNLQNALNYSEKNREHTIEKAVFSGDYHG